MTDEFAMTATSGQGKDVAAEAGPATEARPEVLIVDDREENLVALESLLADLEVRVIRARSGNEALALTLEHEFALALVDVQMPGMDGYEMVAILRQDRRTELLPVIFLSAVYAGDYYHIKGIEAGAVDFLEKPIVPAILLGKVRIFLRLHQAKKKEEQMREMQERMHRQEQLAAVGKIAGFVRHDLRNPLGVIGNSIYFLKSRLVGADDKVARHLAIIEQQVAKADAIIGDLLDFSKAMAPKPTLCDLREIVRQSLESLVIPAKIRVEVSFAGEITTVWLDGELMERLLKNLIKNGVEAMPEGGRLDIEVRIGAEQVEIAVADQGVGIAEEHLDKIFEPLYTLKPGGSGLGLACVKHIVEEHRGKIEVNSRVGRGTRFTVRLPVGSEK